MANGGGKDDKLDELVLDEDFVRGARITELDAKHRRSEAAKRDKALARQNRRYHRQLRRARFRRSVFSARTGVFVVLAVAVALAVPGSQGKGPWAWLGDRIEGSDSSTVEAASAPTTAADTAPTSTTVVLEKRTFKVGDCVVWDEKRQHGYQNETDVVPCDQPHLMEVTGSFEMTDAAYPSEGAWDAVFDSGRCAEMGAAYFGGKLDPAGRYQPRGIIPLREGWMQGDREVWCGLGRVPDDQASIDGAPHLFTGRAVAGDQFRVYAVGSCLGPDGEGLTFGTVPCDGPHRVEITGHVDIRNRASTLPAEGAYQRLVGDDCERLARAYAGKNLRNPVGSGWMWIDAGSWDAGQRTVMCTVAEYRGGEAATITRRLGA